MDATEPRAQARAAVALLSKVLDQDDPATPNRAVLYDLVVVRLASVVRRRRRVLGGSPFAARWTSQAWRASQASRMRWLRAMSRVAVNKVIAVRPIRRHQPREMSLLDGSLVVEKVRSAPVRRA